MPPACGCWSRRVRPARAKGTALRLAAPSPAVGRVLEIAGLLQFFEVFADVDAALKA
ncbi:STAS domain-containing protein [Actinospica acidithermotolerans]|uniref:STAS domain-containing protein n=1 Tax=Actinospica acidithermotolerans TaxID=2828514 RepID=UPI0035570E77